jgi:isoamylase
VTPEGREFVAEDWQKPYAKCMGYLLNGRAGDYVRGPTGQRDVDTSFLVLVNAHHEDVEFQAPATPAPMRWEAVIDTAEETGRAPPGIEIEPDRPFLLKARSLVLFSNGEVEA